MKKIRIILAIIIPILIIISIFLNWHKNVDRSKVASIYIANFDKLKSTLEIKEDGTYDYYLETEDGEKYFNSNIWRFDDSTGNSVMQFSEFKYFFDSLQYTKEGLIQMQGTWMGSIISDYKGQIKITINGDMGLYYFKQ